MGTCDVHRSDSVATRPMEMDSRLVYRNPPPACPCVAAPANSHAVPSSSLARNRSLMTCAGRLMVSFTLTAS